MELDVRIPEGTTVCAEPSQLQQVIVNLLGNALDAMADQAEAHHRHRSREPDQHGRVLFTIADSGTGIAPEVLAHLFEPFVTTKPRGRGLGLGLAITSRLVEGFGARISAANGPDGGAQFTIEFAASSNGDATTAGNGPWMMRLVSVVVEDDENVRLGVEQAVALAGFPVRAYASAAEALAEAVPGAPVVIVSDVRMPGIDGLQLLDRVLAIDAQIPSS